MVSTAVPLYSFNDDSLLSHRERIAGFLFERTISPDGEDFMDQDHDLWMVLQAIIRRQSEWADDVLGLDLSARSRHMDLWAFPDFDRLVWPDPVISSTAFSNPLCREIFVSGEVEKRDSLSVLRHEVTHLHAAVGMDLEFGEDGLSYPRSYIGFQQNAVSDASRFVAMNEIATEGIQISSGAYSFPGEEGYLAFGYGGAFVIFKHIALRYLERTGGDVSDFLKDYYRANLLGDISFFQRFSDVFGLEALSYLRDLPVSSALHNINYRALRSIFGIDMDKFQDDFIAFEMDDPIETLDRVVIRQH